jgi:hypothetical protein
VSKAAASNDAQFELDEVKKLVQLHVHLFKFGIDAAEAR